MSKPYPHSDYYRDRRSERELCCDFPGDELLISGLHAMQVHFYNNGTNIEIPIVRVMNTAHFLAAYMFATTCSGDQLEYDVMAYDSTARDRHITMLAMLVLIAMLRRTEGLRARQCRNVLLEDRSEDFYEGVSLYEQFVNSEETRFCAEDFETDIMREISNLHEENTRLTKQLENQIAMCKYNQYNIGTQNNYNAPVTINNITNNYAHPQDSQIEHKSPTVEPEDIEPVDTSFFCTGQFAPDIIEKNIRQAIQLASSKADACRRILALETYGYIVLSNVPDDRKAELINPFAAPKYTFTPDDFINARRPKK